MVSLFLKLVTRTAIHLYLHWILWCLYMARKKARGSMGSVGLNAGIRLLAL